jgi:hypothetical protein
MREKGRKKEKQTNVNDKDGRVECKKNFARYTCTNMKSKMLVL